MLFLDNVNVCNNKHHSTISLRHQKKIDALITKNMAKSPNIPAQMKQNFFDRVVNTTDISFTNNELKLLNKGLKHNIAPKLNQYNIKELIVNTKIACATAKLKQNEQNAIAHKANNIIMKNIDQNKMYNSFNIEQRTLHDINKKLSTNSALVVRSDKGNTAVVLYEADYVNKTYEFFSTNNIKEIEYDPTPKFQDKIKKLLKNCNFLLTQAEAKHCVVMNPTPPKLRSQPKIHKPECPIRPVVNSINSPSYKITRKLHDIIKKAYIFENNFSIKNSYELINSIKDIPIPDTAKFASLDIVNLYTNIPIKETVTIIRNNLLKHGTMSRAEIFELIEILELVLSHNYFLFNNKFYIQEDGLAMGSSLAGLLANIYINYLENRFFRSQTHLRDKLLYYKRYVDDTLILFDGTTKEIDNLAVELNKMHPKIHFTVEHETPDGINYLDLTISSKNQKHNFQIFRKPTTTNVSIHNSSCHPDQHKKAFFRSMVNRMLKIPMDNNAMCKETNIIKSIATSNGYNPAIIDKLIQTTKANPPLVEQSPPNNKTTYISLPFLGKVSYQIANLFKTHNIKISFFTNNKIQNKIIHNASSNIERYQKSGVYKLTCDSCPSFYIGQTGRSFRTRFKEHMDALRLKNLNK